MLGSTQRQIQTSLDVTIRKARLSDSGFYHCRMNNSCGDVDYVEIEIRALKVEGPPVRSALVYEASEGQTLTVQCKSKVFGGIVLFCKNRCEEPEDILVRSLGNHVQHIRSGKYTYSVEPSGRYRFILSVPLMNAPLSDSGSYCCLMNDSWDVDQKDFEIRVLRVFKSSTSENPASPNLTSRPPDLGPNAGPSPGTS